MRVSAARDRRAFVEQVLRNPDDDTVRLVFADFLDETARPDEPCYRCSQYARQGKVPDDVNSPAPEWVTCPACDGAAVRPNPDKVWAELIRIQIRLARWPDVPFERPFLRKTQSEEVKEQVEEAMAGGIARLRGREEELVQHLGHEIVGADDLEDYGPPRLVVPGGLVSWRFRQLYGRVLVFRRGFIDAVVCPAEHWLAVGRRLTWHSEERLLNKNYNRLRRRCPVTAHPVRHVLLTTPMQLPAHWKYHGGYVYSRADKYLMTPDEYHTNRLAGVQKAEWPGVVFKPFTEGAWDARGRFTMQHSE